MKPKPPQFNTGELMPLAGKPFEYKILTEIKPNKDNKYTLFFEIPESLDIPYIIRVQTEYETIIGNLNFDNELLRRESVRINNNYSRLEADNKANLKELAKVKTSNKVLSSEIHDLKKQILQLKSKIDRLNKADVENSKALCEMLEVIENKEIIIKQLKMRCM